MLEDQENGMIPLRSYTTDTRDNSKTARRALPLPSGAAKLHEASARRPGRRAVRSASGWISGYGSSLNARRLNCQSESNVIDYAAS